MPTPPNAPELLLQWVVSIGFAFMFGMVSLYAGVLLARKINNVLQAWQHDNQGKYD